MFLRLGVSAAIRFLRGLTTLPNERCLFAVLVVRLPFADRSEERRSSNEPGDDDARSQRHRHLHRLADLLNMPNDRRQVCVFHAGRSYDAAVARATLGLDVLVHAAGHELPRFDPELRRRDEITKRESPPISDAALAIPLGRF